jgi:hypothetical protein
MLTRNATLTCGAALAATLLLAHGNPREELQAEVGSAAVSVEYGRPSLKGRDMLGQATPGMRWRVGADGAATLTTSAGLAFGETALAAGRYTLEARKGEGDGWTLLLEGGDATTEVPLQTRQLGESVELFTILLSGEGSAGSLELRWGTRALSTGFASAD